MLKRLMINSPYVLIVSTVADLATDDVVRCLAADSIPHQRINTEDFPFLKTFTFRPGGSTTFKWMGIDGMPLGRPAAIWYRRVRSSSKPDDMDEGIYEFCLQENRAALLGGMLSSTSKWMSHPAAVWQAEHKLYQLDLAAQVGLRIPKTVVTNDPGEVRHAFAEFREMIVKPAKSGYARYKEGEFGVFTSRVHEQDLKEIDSARWSPAIYQEHISKRFDLRVTIVGHRVFAAEIDSQSDPEAMTDWRQTKNPRLPHHPATLPSDLVAKLLLLMSRLNLSFGAIDLIQTPEGEYVFLEVNPSGQWLWLDDMLDFGISKEIASWLAAPIRKC